MGNGMECLPVEHDNEPSTLVDERTIATDEAGMEERGQDLTYGGRYQRVTATGDGKGGGRGRGQREV